MLNAIPRISAVAIDARLVNVNMLSSISGATDIGSHFTHATKLHFRSGCIGRDDLGTVRVQASCPAIEPLVWICHAMTSLSSPQTSDSPQQRRCVCGPLHPILTSGIKVITDCWSVEKSNW
jgi:hypothetical protein